MTIKDKLKAYFENSRAIRRTQDNPLKKTDNLTHKNQLEKEFWDHEAISYLDNFNDERFIYKENEDMPISHKFAYGLFDNIKDKNILDICCGYGFTSVRLAKKGNNIVAIDISPKMIELAKRNSELNDLSDKVSLTLMSAENMAFEDESFDYVIGFGALHHLNLELAGKEISRVLKKGGRAIFLEPRLPFRWLLYIRSLFPNKCLESPGGGQLNDKDIALLSGYFFNTQIDYFLFLRKLTRFSFMKSLSDRLDKYDLYLIKRFRFLRKLYWAFVLQFTK